VQGLPSHFGNGARPAQHRRRRPRPKYSPRQQSTFGGGTDTKRVIRSCCVSCVSPKTSLIQAFPSCTFRSGRRLCHADSVSLTQTCFQPLSDKITVILFLAHDGVHQPDLWTAWKEASAQQKQQQRLVFHVFANAAVAAKCAFVAQHRLDIADRKTQWADWSLVDAYVVSLQKILELHGAESINRIFLVPAPAFRCGLWRMS
jgi:hypothetical protein